MCVCVCVFVCEKTDTYNDESCVQRQDSSPEKYERKIGCSDHGKITIFVQPTTDRKVKFLLPDRASTAQILLGANEL